MPILYARNRLALLGACLLGLGVAFGAFQPAVPPFEPLPDYVGFINPNSADAATLERLPGVGPVLAKRIVEERTLHGPFLSWRGLQRVKGIGPKLAEKLRAWLTFDG